MSIGSTVRKGCRASGRIWRQQISRWRRRASNRRLRIGKLLRLLSPRSTRPVVEQVSPSRPTTRERIQKIAGQDHKTERLTKPSAQKTPSFPTKLPTTSSNAPSRYWRKLCGLPLPASAALAVSRPFGSFRTRRAQSCASASKA